MAGRGAQAELQGKQEQADDIRRGILKVPGRTLGVWNSERVPELLERAFDPKQISRKPQAGPVRLRPVLRRPPLIDQLDQHRFESARP